MKTITVVESTLVKTGVSSTGKEWALYEITAIDRDGAPIEEKLKSFDRLQGTVEVEVERQDNEKFGVSYMLKLPRGAPGAGPAPSSGARLGPSVDALRERVELLERRIDQLVTAVGPMPEMPAAPERPGGATF